MKNIFSTKTQITINRQIKTLSNIYDGLILENQLI